MDERRPHIVVLSTLFPHPGQPNAGVFIRERMFRVGRHLPLAVVAPQPWFPFQALIRRWRPHWRPPAPLKETQQGYEVFHPRFFSVPGLLKSFDGVFMALGAFRVVKALHKQGRCDLIDAHFAFPDGDAGTLLGRWLKVPVTITLRGTEVPLARLAGRRRRMLLALQRAARVFSVADALRRHAVALGVAEEKTQVVGNGVDAARFQAMPKEEARRRLDLPTQAPVLITIGGLTERKGFHRVIELLPALRQQFPGLCYLVVGGASAEGDWGPRLRGQVAELGLQDAVRFLGALPPDELKWPLSAADVFVLATRNEGWANVILEAMACALPVVTTDVGGNAEVVCSEELGTVVPFGDAAALRAAIAEALRKPWDREAIKAHARQNAWDLRIDELLRAFGELYGADTSAHVAHHPRAR